MPKPRRSSIANSYKRKIRNEHSYHEPTRLTLITNSYVFYCTECPDESGGVIMYDRDLKLLSNNFFAFDFLIGIMMLPPDERLLWTSRAFRYNHAETLKNIGSGIYDHEIVESLKQQRQNLSH